MTRKNGIDLFRFFGAFFIMCLHTSYGDLNHEIVENIRLFSRWAVPFFFIITGYFTGFKIEGWNLDFKRIQKNIATLISILVISCSVYFLSDLGLNVEKILADTCFHMWFICSLLVGYIFIWYILFMKLNTLLPYISTLILIFSLFSDSYDQFSDTKIDFFFPRLSLSVPFIYIGIIFSKTKINLIKNTYLIGLVLLGLILQTLESEMFLNLFNYSKFDHQFLIGTIIVVIPLFILCSKMNLRENILSKWGEEHSLFIYLYHPLAYRILSKFVHKVFPDNVNSIQKLFPLLGFISILLTAIFLKHFFKKLYNILTGNIIG